MHATYGLILSSFGSYILNLTSLLTSSTRGLYPLLCGEHYTHQDCTVFLQQQTPAIAPSPPSNGFTSTHVHPPLTPPNTLPLSPTLSLSAEQVRKELSNIKAKKAVDPGDISSGTSNPAQTNSVGLWSTSSTRA